MAEEFGEVVDQKRRKDDRTDNDACGHCHHARREHDGGERECRHRNSHVENKAEGEVDSICACHHFEEGAAR